MVVLVGTSLEVGPAHRPPVLVGTETRVLTGDIGLLPFPIPYFIFGEGFGSIPLLIFPFILCLAPPLNASQPPRNVLDILGDGGQ